MMTQGAVATQGAVCSPGCNEIRGWLLDEIALLMAKPREEIRTDQPFFEFGLDSAAAIGLTDLLAEWLDRDIDPVLLYDHPTIDELAQALAVGATP